MNTNILKKCVEELKKEKFSKEYVMGMLETLIEMQTPSNYVIPVNNTVANLVEAANNMPPVITGFKDLIPKEDEKSKDAESAYLSGRIGRV